MALPIIGIPTYETQLPSSGESITYRPFLVKEEKILLMAMESKNDKQTIGALRQIITNCVITDGFLVDNIPLFDVEWLFLQLRSKSVGNVATPYIKLDCGAEIKLEIKLDDIHMKTTKDHSVDVVLFKDKKRKIGVIMKYPKLELAMKLGGKTSKNGENQDPMLAFDVVKQCIHQIYENDTLTDASDVSDKEMDGFLEGLTQDQFILITDFFETMPKLEHEVQAYNPCTKEQTRFVLKGLQDFFRSSSLITP